MSPFFPQNKRHMNLNVISWISANASFCLSSSDNRASVEQKTREARNTFCTKISAQDKLAEEVVTRLAMKGFEGLV